MHEMCPQCDCTCSRDYVLFFKLLALLLRGPEHVQVWQLIIELESYTPQGEVRFPCICVEQLQGTVSIIGHNVLSDTESSRPPNESAHGQHECIVRAILSRLQHNQRGPAKGLKTCTSKISIRPICQKSINRHGLLLRLREANMAMTAVIKRGVIPYHTQQESQPGVEQLRYQNSFNSIISADQLSCHVHHLAYCTYSHFCPIPSLLLRIYQFHKLLYD